MIIKNFELDKIDIKNFNLFLFYGDNQGFKDEIVEKICQQKNLKKTLYFEKEVLSNTENFLNSISSKSFFENEKIIVIKNATDKLKKMIDDCMKEMKESVNEGDGEPGVDYRSDTGEGETKKAAIGHIDNEKGMIKKELYLIGKNAIDVHKMLDGLPDSAFPHWWQAKIVKAHEYIQGAKNYLDAELNEPKAEPVVSDEVTSVDDPSGVS